MLRHKKELRDHQLMKMRRELDAVDLEGKTRLEIDQEWDRICKKYDPCLRPGGPQGPAWSHGPGLPDPSQPGPPSVRAGDSRNRLR